MGYPGNSRPSVTAPVTTLLRDEDRGQKSESEFITRKVTAQEGPRRLLKRVNPSIMGSMSWKRMGVGC